MLDVEMRVAGQTRLGRRIRKNEYRRAHAKRHVTTNSYHFIHTHHFLAILYNRGISLATCKSHIGRRTKCAPKNSSVLTIILRAKGTLSARQGHPQDRLITGTAWDSTQP